MSRLATIGLVAIGIASAGVLAMNHGLTNETITSPSSHSKAEQVKTEWYISSQRQIAPGETVKMLVIPSVYGTKIFDGKCLIYTNTNTNTSNINCFNGNPEDLSE